MFYIPWHAVVCLISEITVVVVVTAVAVVEEAVAHAAGQGAAA